MSTLERIGYTKHKLATGAIEWTKDGEPSFMICDWSRPSEETHGVIFFGDGENIHISQNVILAIAEIIINSYEEEN